MEIVLNLDQAFRAMINFLEVYYKKAFLAGDYCYTNSLNLESGRRGKDGVACVLSDIALVHKHQTMDPAAWHDWLDAVCLVLNKPKTSTTYQLERETLVSIEAFKAMGQFLKAYYLRTSSWYEDIELILNDIRLTNGHSLKDPNVWEQWLRALELALQEPEPSSYESCQCCQNLLK